VIPRWIAALVRNQAVFINGDGETSRDFCHIENVIQANLLAALAVRREAVNQIYNVALNERTSLNQLYRMILNLLLDKFPGLVNHKPNYVDFREGDVRHSQADISKAREMLGFQPTHRIDQGLEQAMEWYLSQLAPEKE
jgi:UDP-N-acetylglucosamine 4-epimerase